jgi:hypothetical protein
MDLWGLFDCSFGDRECWIRFRVIAGTARNINFTGSVLVSTSVGALRDLRVCFDVEDQVLACPAAAAMHTITNEDGIPE